MAQRFYNLVLLPRIRDDIAEYKRLNFHLYMALKKALFKPAAWFKGKGSPLGLGWLPEGLIHARDPPGLRGKGLSPQGCAVGEGGRCLTVPIPRDPHPAL